MSRICISKIGTIIVTLSLLFCVASPIVASAQTTPPASNTSVTQTASVGSNPSSVCNGLYNFFSQPLTCIGITMATFLGTTIIYLASWVLTVAGLLFNWSISETISYFGQFVNQNLITAINTAWSAFRDISNIVIIGMFTFIAIMTILGNVEYGYKKMLSRVLIVAVLINFSLLFTKIIIDVSNFTAIQFFTAAGNTISQSQQFAGSGSGSGATSVSASGQSGPSTGIAGAFLQYAGANSFGNTNAAVTAIATNPNNGGMIALTYGIVVGMLELVAALVLFYGSFLLITRGLLMIFLMITSSVAFASYLIPSASSGSFGWSAWWSALLKNALFAPLLAVLLWVTLTVAQAFNTVTNGGNVGSLGALITNPTATIDISALFGYFIVIGLLFISLRVSSSFASSVGGLQFGQGAWDRFQSNLLSATGSGLLGAGRFFGRNTGGAAAYRQEQKFAKTAQNLNAQAKAAFDVGDTDKFNRLTKQMNAAAKNSLRFGALGAGYKKQVQEKAKKVADVVNRAQVPGDEREKQAREAQAIADIAKSNADKLTQGLKETQKQSADAAKIVGEEVEKAIGNGNDSLKKTFEANRDAAVGQANEENKKKLGELDTKIQNLNKTIDTSNNDGEKQRALKQLVETKAARASEMDQQNERVKKAEQVALINTANSEAAKELMARNETMRTAAQKLAASHAEETSTITLINEARGIHQNTPSKEDRQELHRASTEAMVNVVAKDDDVASKARELLKTNRESGRAKQVINAFLKEDTDKLEPGK